MIKKLLNILGTVTLTATSTTSLVACNTPQEKEYTPEELEHLKKENQINTSDETIKNNLEGIAPQEKPFVKVDKKGYFVVGRKQEQPDWKITKFNNDKGVIEIENNLMKTFQDLNYFTELDKFAKILHPGKTDPQFFKAVYRGNLNTNIPNLTVDSKTGEIKVEGK